MAEIFLSRTFCSLERNALIVIVNVHVALFLMIKANPLPHGLDKIPDAQGYLVINSDGAVLASSGDLEMKRTLPATITRMLQTAAKIPISGDRTQTFKRMSVYYRDFTLMATVSNQKIFVVKRPLKQESE
ncbi:Ragulator complex protein lamtor4 [Desmophyllum pertusum]|uniref:Late endosomal/lysosomal adaptor and MAPK and MTOR activator 4 n=1 Tax=Desmophyllum pertusum TaxID=174260 RepID=A0A9X0A4T1_9CNID|nr:Ragulator complex protein lamtor4 [Desmophyllum pertusum]